MPISLYQIMPFRIIDVSLSYVNYRVPVRNMSYPQN